MTKTFNIAKILVCLLYNIGKPLVKLCRILKKTGETFGKPVVNVGKTLNFCKALVNVDKTC